MPQLSDIEIARENKRLPIAEVAKKAGFSEEAVIARGRDMAKIDLGALSDKGNEGKLILVTAINPTPAGEGKTTTAIGLMDALSRRGEKVIGALREPSMGPVFGIKGGAAGGGYAQVVPMEEINLHFTGDFHAVSAANNLLAAMIDNHIHHGNALRIDPRKVTWRRCMDMNDRQLRYVIDGLGGRTNGVPREEGFDISAASEVMAAFCLADGLEDLKERLSRLVIGYTYTKAGEERPVTAGELGAAGAMTALLRDALQPNLVQTLEHTPVFIHGGPFANIAHGCNSVLATRLALSKADYCVTEAGFGADLGAEKFLNIKCRMSGLLPSAVVLVATVRALKYNGGVKKEDLSRENLEALAAGLPNLLHHIRTIREVYQLPCVVAINNFPADTEAEIELVRSRCEEVGVKAVLSEVWAKGGEGGSELAEEVVRLASGDANPQFTYPLEGTTIEEKINLIATRVYGADGVDFELEAKKRMEKYSKEGYADLPVCVAKTQYSLTDNPKKLGEPKGFRITVRDVKLSAGAGFLVALTGEIMTMPGLPARPSAVDIDVDKEGNIHGLF